MDSLSLITSCVTLRAIWLLSSRGTDLLTFFVFGLGFFFMPLVRRGPQVVASPKKPKLGHHRLFPALVTSVRRLYSEYLRKSCNAPETSTCLSTFNIIVRSFPSLRL